MSLVEYTPGTAFPGVIGRTFDVSSPAWPKPLRAKAGAPNVLFIVQDDTGFEYLSRERGLVIVGPFRRQWSPGAFGLTLITIGTLALAVGVTHSSSLSASTRSRP